MIYLTAITLKHYTHLWSRNDEPIAEKIAGNIRLTPTKETMIDFNGNQNIEGHLITYQNPTMRTEKESESNDNSST